MRTSRSVLFIVGALGVASAASAQTLRCEGRDTARGEMLSSRAVDLFVRATAHRDRIDLLDLQRALADATAACDAGSVRSLLIRALVLHALSRDAEATEALDAFRLAVPDAQRTPAQRETMIRLEAALPARNPTALAAPPSAPVVTTPTPAPATTPAPLESPAPLRPTAEHPWRTWAIVASSATGLALVGALGATAWRETRSSHYSDLRCGATNGSDVCLQAWGSFQSVDTLSTVAWVTTGALALTTAALWWLDLRAPTRHASTTRGCVAMPGAVRCVW